MKRVYLLSLVLACVAFLFCQSAFSQEKKEKHFFVITTWKLEIPEDGSNAELDSLFTVWHNKVITPNDKIISQKVLRHYWGHDMRDWVVITEYANWGDIDASGDVADKLIEEAWPDKAERTKFFKTFFKYAETHSDEIYQENPDLTK